MEFVLYLTTNITYFSCVTILFSHSELSLVGEGGRGITTTEVVIGDVHSKFTEAVRVFSSGKQVRHRPIVWNTLIERYLSPPCTYIRIVGNLQERETVICGWRPEGTKIYLSKFLLRLNYKSFPTIGKQKELTYIVIN